MFLEACSLHRICANVGLLNLIGVQQLKNLVRITKHKNVCAWIVQCSAYNKLNAIEGRKIKKLKWFVFML